MIVWSMKLSTGQIRTMRLIADAEIEGVEFEGQYSKFHPMFRSLRVQGLVTEKTDGRRRKSTNLQRPEEIVKYRLSALGVAILAAVDAEASAMARPIGKDEGDEQ